MDLLFYGKLAFIQSHAEYAVPFLPKGLWHEEDEQSFAADAPL
jgi:hypothetical protein